ncbi:MAG: hypothetical protein Tsb0013_13750 [Phycisphaerales bacterium]
MIRGRLGVVVIGLGLLGMSVVGCAPTEKEPAREPVMPIPDPVPAPEGARTASAGADEEPERIADDGRPAWWFPEVRREGSRLLLCVETIASGSLRDANRRAVEVAQERASLETDRAGHIFADSAMAIEKAWGWPLPALPGREAQYAGYALVAVDLSALPRSE